MAEPSAAVLYTAITFAPVQSFIRSSRKLRDLYGSSLLLSHLARTLADDAAGRGFNVISPAGVSSSRGVPNVLVIAGDYRKGQAREALLHSWKRVLQACRDWLEQALAAEPFAPASWEQGWGASWKACGQHSWELFHGQGATIAAARQALAVNKLQRDWSSPNWTGESSSLSSAEAVVRPSMAAVIDPRALDPAEAQREARAFIAALRHKPELGPAFAGEKEELSLCELVKRLVTYGPVARQAFAVEGQAAADPRALLPERFQRLSGSEEERPESIVWFMADGDQIGAHLEQQASRRGEAEALARFSAEMRAWAAGLYAAVPERMPDRAMVVYAGGDDVFGALHESVPGGRDLRSDHLWQWLATFPELWQPWREQGLTVSMGLVWADAAVPQREALQHAREAEASAKARGRDRFALRLLYASGNHLEWTCPWSLLATVRGGYRDRTHRSGDDAHWRHLADDLAWLRSRQALAGTGAEAVAHSLWRIYFPGAPPPRQPEEGRDFADWLLDLGRVMAGLEKWEPQRQEVAA